MKKAKVDIWVGLFVLLGFLAVLFLALKAGNMSAFTTGAQYRVLAEFDNIGGLKPRAPVKSAGVVVGRVADIRLDPATYRAVVALDLQEAFVFPTDSSAKILTSGLLGEQYVGIEAGGDEANLAAGQKFSRTQSAVVLESLISQFLYNKASETPAAAAKP
jgi:phospholipid/cholesterol/gamma-HCH transport system substrate-binding protein